MSEDNKTPDQVSPSTEQRTELRLSVPDSEAFAAALAEARPVGERLRDTVRRYFERLPPSS